MYRVVLKQMMAECWEVVDGESFRLGVHSSKLQQGCREVTVPVVQWLHGHADGAGERGGVVAERRMLANLVERCRQQLGVYFCVLIVVTKNLAERKQRQQLRVTREDAQEHLDADLLEVRVTGHKSWPRCADQLSLTKCCSLKVATGLK